MLYTGPSILVAVLTRYAWTRVALLYCTNDDLRGLRPVFDLPAQGEVLTNEFVISELRNLNRVLRSTRCSW